MLLWRIDFTCTWELGGEDVQIAEHISCFGFVLDSVVRRERQLFLVYFEMDDRLALRGLALV